MQKLILPFIAPTTTDGHTISADDDSRCLIPIGLELKRRVKIKMQTTFLLHKVPNFMAPIHSFDPPNFISNPPTVLMGHPIFYK